MTAAVEAVRLRLRVRAPDLSALRAAPWALTLSTAAVTTPGPSSTPATTPAGPATTAGAPVRLAVPPLSQMEADAALAHRICSPTCVAMVLGYWRRPAAVAELAREVFHPGTDLYGVWPAAILALGDATIDFGEQRIVRRGHSVPLSRREGELVRYLAERRDRVVYRDELLREVWGYPESPMTRSVDHAIARLPAAKF